MSFSDEFVHIDADFDCGSAGQISGEGGSYEVGPQPEEVPEWFAAALEEHFAGAGVPREYAHCVRISSKAEGKREIRVRFRFTQTNGRDYMAPPYWFFRDGRWRPVALGATDYMPRSHVDLNIDLDKGETLLLANKPYLKPGVVEEMIDDLVDRYPFFHCRELGKTAEGRSILVLETDAREDTIVVAATMQPAEPGANPVLGAAHWLTDRSALSERLLDRFQFSFIPMSNPDGAAHGCSLTNALAEVPMFSFGRLLEGQSAPLETEAIWRYMEALSPAAYIEFHPHYQDVHSHKLNPMALEWYPSSMHGKVQQVEDALIGLNSSWRVTHLEKALPLGDCSSFNHLAYLFKTLVYCYQIYAISEEATRSHAVQAVSTLACALAGPEWLAQNISVKIVRG